MNNTAVVIVFYLRDAQTDSALGAIFKDPPTVAHKIKRIDHSALSTSSFSIFLNLTGPGP